MTGDKPEREAGEEPAGVAVSPSSGSRDTLSLEGVMVAGVTIPHVLAGACSGSAPCWELEWGSLAYLSEWTHHIFTKSLPWTRH